MSPHRTTPAALAATALTAALLAFPLAAPAAATPAKPCDPSKNCLSRLPLTSGATLPYLATYPLTGTPAARTAVIVIHGTGRNATNYFKRMYQAAGRHTAHTAIIAPHFQTTEDKPAARDAYWTNGGAHSWKDGGDAERPSGLSSFQAMDEILRALADRSRFPNLTHVTLTGHSAGGQFVQRYAAGGRVPTGLSINFVPANPSSYLYLTPKRPVTAGLGSCPEYDNYKYGLRNRNPYMAKPSPAEIHAQYSTRKVTYLLGEQDTQQDDDLDKTCPAKAQGKHRFERGRFYANGIAQLFPAAPHRMVTVPGVGHDSGAMYNSAQGKAVIFPS